MRRISQDSVVDQVATEILEAILDGELRPGEPFRVSDVSQTLGVSHIPIREALRFLESRGLIELRPGRSAVVARMDVEDAREIYRLRKLVEVATVGRAATRYTDEEVGTLEALAERMAVGSFDGRDYWDTHSEFQWILVRPGADSWTEHILHLLWQASERYYRLVRAAGGSLNDHHGPLVEAARARSRHRLQELVAEHLEASLGAIEAAVAAAGERRPLDA